MKTAAIALVAILSALLLLASGYGEGQATAQRACQADMAAAAVRRANATTQLSEQHRTAEQRLTATLAQQAATARKQAAHVQDQHQSLVDRLHRGAVSVSIPALRCTPDDPTPADSGVGPAAARAQLAPETASALDRIATDGDIAIVDLNQCLAAHAAARAALIAIGQPR